MTELMSLVWFFPLCAMHISGYETLSVLWFSPLLLLVPPLRRTAATPLALFLLRLLMLVGVASFHIHDLLSRLVTLAVGNFFVLLVLPASLCGLSKLDRLAEKERRYKPLVIEPPRVYYTCGASFVLLCRKSHSPVFVIAL